LRKISEEKINEIFTFWREYYEFKIPSVIAFVLDSKEWKEVWELRKVWYQVVTELIKAHLLPVKVGGKEEIAHANSLPSLQIWMKKITGFVFKTKTYTQFKELEVFRPYLKFLNLISPYEWTVILKKRDYDLALFEELTHIVENEARTLILPENRIESEKVLRRFFIEFMKWKTLKHW
jgi:hypothetical protein